MNAAPLQDLRVLVTRPVERADGLIERIAATGGEPIAFPVIEIVACSPARRPRVDRFSIVLFVSPAAVTHGLAALDLAPDRAAFGAVGPATAQALEQAGQRVDIRAQGSADSEGLLAHEALQATRIDGKRILVVRGAGGREHLATSLVERGATVEYAEVYRRALPSRYDPDRVVGCDIVTATSAEGLDNLLAMIAAGERERIRGCPLAVSATRIGEHARARGFTGPIASAERPGDEGLMAAIFQCAGRTDSPS